MLTKGQIITMILVIVLTLAGFFGLIANAAVTENRYVINSVRELVELQRVKFLKEKAERDTLKQKIAEYRTPLGKKVDLIEITVSGAQAAKDIAKKNFKEILSSQTYGELKNYLLKPETQAKAEEIKEDIKNAIIPLIADQAAGIIINESQRYIELSFSSAWEDYNYCAAAHNIVLSSSPWTAWYYDLKRVKYLDQEGNEVELIDMPK